MASYGGFLFTMKWLVLKDGMVEPWPDFNRASTFEFSFIE